MNRLIAALVVGGTIAVLWPLAQRAARQRDVHLGRPPLPLFAAVALLAAAVPNPAVVALAGAATVAAIFDARTGYLPDELTLAVAVLAGGAALASRDPLGGLFGAAAGGGTLGALYVVTQRRGIGFGDVKFGAALATALGPQLGIVAVGTAFVAGGCYALAALARGAVGRRAEIRFGPYLALGAMSAPLIGPWLAG